MRHIHTCLSLICGRRSSCDRCCAGKGADDVLLTTFDAGSGRTTLCGGCLRDFAERTARMMAVHEQREQREQREAQDANSPA